LPDRLKRKRQKTNTSMVPLKLRYVVITHYNSTYLKVSAKSRKD
jgi:hypothetical protein